MNQLFEFSVLHSDSEVVVSVLHRGKAGEEPLQVGSASFPFQSALQVPCCLACAATVVAMRGIHRFARSAEKKEGSSGCDGGKWLHVRGGIS